MTPHGLQVSIGISPSLWYKLMPLSCIISRCGVVTRWATAAQVHTLLLLCSYKLPVSSSIFVFFNDYLSCLLFNRYIIHIIDLDPQSASAGGWLEDTSLVQKYVMSDDEYNKRENTYRCAVQLSFYHWRFSGHFHMDGSRTVEYGIPHRILSACAKNNLNLI